MAGRERLERVRKMRKSRERMDNCGELGLEIGESAEKMEVYIRREEVSW